MLTDKNVWCDLADSTEESRGVTQRNVMTEAVRAQEAVFVTRRWERVGLLVNDQYSTTKFDTL